MIIHGRKVAELNRDIDDASENAGVQSGQDQKKSIRGVKRHRCEKD